MSWQILGQAIAILAFGLVASITMSIVLPLIRDRFFPHKPEYDYTYYITAKGGKKAKVVLPPDMPEIEQQEIMRRAYEHLGLPPQSHYPVPMPDENSSLWALRRHTTRVFKADNAQAITIPSEIAYIQPDIELDIQRVGDELRIRPRPPAQ